MTMRIAAAGMLMATLIAVAVIAAPALLGVSPWVPSQHHVQAEPNACYLAARHYRNDFNYEPPLWCWGSSWFRATDGQWDRPLPANQNQGTRPSPPAPPGDVPPPPPGDE
jgi:hypothetical protein